MRIFRRPSRVLKVQLPGRLIKLYPGDTLHLTHEAHADINGRSRVRAEVTHEYVWDGDVLILSWWSS